MSTPGSMVGSNVVASSDLGSQAFPDNEDFICLSDLINDDSFMLPDLPELMDVDGMDSSLGMSDDWQEPSGVGRSFITNRTTNDNGIPLVGGDGAFLELNDLVDPLINFPTDDVDQWLRLLEEGFDGLGEHLDMSQVNSGAQEIVDMEYPLSSCDDNFTPMEQPEEGEVDDARA